MDHMKSNIINEIEKNQQEIIELSRRIHGHPELGFQEYKAMEWMTELLEEKGFEVHKGSGNIPTAFKAVFKGKEGGPRVAFLAEYDALPEIGHGCGHHIIAASAVGAAIGLSSVVKEGIGEVMVIGTPAEESGGGKILLIDAGEFDEVDYALMLHPGTKNMVGRGGAATTGVVIEFQGKSAHSASPEEGVNALQAMIHVFNGIDSLRATLQDFTRINGIITHGGSASNVIPDYSRAEFTVRAKTRSYLELVLEKIQTIAKSVETMTGAEGKIKTELLYAERYPNDVMGEAFKNNMTFLGEEVSYPVEEWEKNPMGASDIGNVSLKIPTIHPYIKIMDNMVNSHSREYAEAAGTNRAMEAMIKGAKALAMTGYDILVDEEMRKYIKQEFDTKVIGRNTNPLEQSVIA